MFHAVHLVSSSCDHYNVLIEASTPEEFVEWFVKNQCDLAYIDQVYVDSQDESKSDIFRDALSDAIDAATDAAEEEY